MYEHCPVNPVIFLATGSETEIGHAKNGIKTGIEIITNRTKQE